MKLQFDYTLFGLEPRDLTIYEAMLADPQAVSVRTIAEKVGLNRGTTFEVIKKLVRFGLVSGVNKGERKKYIAEPPQALQGFAEQVRGSLEDELPKLKRYSARLEEIVPKEADPVFGRYYEGEDEIAVLLQDVLNSVTAQADKTYRVISSAEVSSHMYGKFRNFTRQRIKKHISVQVIGVGGQGELSPLAERKSLASDEIPASYTIIYGDKVAQITLTSLGDIQGAVVENVGVAQLQRLLFDTLWERL